MTNTTSPALATPMPAPVRARYAASAHNALSLTPADVAELDPMGTGSIELLGLTYVREACGATYPALDLVCTLPVDHTDAHEAPCTDPGWELSTMVWEA